MTPKFCIEHRDEDGTRTFYTDDTGRGLWQEARDGNDRQLVGTCDAGPFRDEAAFRRFVERRFS